MRTAAQIDADLEAWDRVLDLAAQIDTAIPTGDPLAEEIRRHNDLTATVVGQAIARARRDRPDVEQLGLEVAS